MTSNDDSRKHIEQAEYRAKLVEAELNAIRSSKAYQLSKKLGIIKAQIKSDPVGLSKKVARILLTDPKKARHLLRSADRGAMIAQSVAEQNTKYQEWILLHEPDEADLDRQRSTASKLGYKPLISIITPVWNPPVDVLEELIESILEQTYTNFELCLGDFGDDEAVAALLLKYSELDTRIKYYRFDNNAGIAGNSNQILEKVTGEYIALLDHDDTLSLDALYENVLLLNQKPYDFIYSDKDKIDEKGNRFDPLYKPEWSPEMMLNINYLTHLNVMRTSIVRKIGGWDPETDGAQDWDLFLRVISESKEIGFIPKILYHWRVIATSTAMSIETKPYALANQCKAVDKYLIKNNIPARAYIQRTELFLRWDPTVLDDSPLVFLYFSSLTNTLRVIRRFRKVTQSAHFVVLLAHDLHLSAEDIAREAGVEAVAYNPATIGTALDTYLAASKQPADKTVIIMLDSIRLPKDDAWYENLTGWLSIKDVGAASGRLVDRNDLIVSSGGLVTAEQHYFPLFQNYPRYYQSYLGNAEWIRNLSIISSVFCATKLVSLKQFNFSKAVNQDHVFDAYFLWLSRSKRLVMSPHATASVFENNDIDLERSVVGSVSGAPKAAKRGFVDPYSNPNMSPADPLRLFDDERLQGMADSDQPSAPVDSYQHDATILADTFDITAEEMAASRRIVTAKHSSAPTSVAWFLPSFDAVYAGLMNIFSFANYLARVENLQTTVYILKSTPDVSIEKSLVVAAFPSLSAAEFIAITPATEHLIGNHDIGIATQWASAFPLAKASMIARKCYFIQDNEVNFYPKGSISALVALSYQFGFTAIAGTEGLLDMYQSVYGGSGAVLGSRVDLSAYHPRPDKYYTPRSPYKVFFYARPNMPRNAFELGIAGLKRLKQALGESVEIITAGAQWDAVQYGVEGMFSNLGKIDYEAVPKLYRSVDVGLMFMFSGHPGVTASELMASGCPVVVNEYDDVTWHELYQHEKTCLISTATASEVARNLQRCLEDTNLRKTLINNGLKKANEFYAGYESSLPKVYAALQKEWRS